MRKAYVEFAMVVAVGINSYALMDLTEEYKETFGFTPEGDSECVKNDIEAAGFSDWVESNLDDVPTAVGTYAFAGSAWFDEDSADYSATCLDI
jgi:hypothetical protein